MIGWPWTHAHPVAPSLVDTHRPDRPSLPVSWRSSSASSTLGATIQVAHLAGRIWVRDSKNPDGPILEFPSENWAVFIDAVQYVKLINAAQEDEFDSDEVDELARRDYAALIRSLKNALDVRDGLAEAVNIAHYTTMGNQITSQLNLEAGLQAALATMNAQAELDHQSTTHAPPPVRPHQQQQGEQ